MPRAVASYEACARHLDALAPTYQGVVERTAHAVWVTFPSGHFLTLRDEGGVVAWILTPERLRLWNSVPTSLERFEADVLSMIRFATLARCP